RAHRDLHPSPTRRSSDLDVGILDAQDEGAAVTTGEGPGEQRGTGAADVQIAGGAGSEAGADRAGCGILGHGSVGAILCKARILRDRKSTRLNSSHVKISY